MFKNEFQGGSFVEVFSAQGRDPVSKWRLSGSPSAFKKIFDKEVKSYVYVLEGESTTTKMSIPKDERNPLFLIQKYVVMQVYVPLGHSFSFELSVTDLGNNKRRIFLSSSHRDITVTPLHARFPLSILRLGVWLNLCLDLNSLIGETFKEQTFKSIDSLTLSANCHLRKIFTMKTQPPDTTDDDDIYGCNGMTNAGDLEPIPKSMQFATTNFQTQVINLFKLRQADAKAKEAAGLPPSTSPLVSDIDMSSWKHHDQPKHIAFGSRIVIPKHARKSSREGGPGSAGSRSSANSFQRSSSISNVRAGSPLDLDSSTNSLTHRSKFQRSMSETTEIDQSKLQLEVEALPTSIQPRPPRTGSGTKSRRRPLRVKTKDTTGCKSAGSRTNEGRDRGERSASNNHDQASAEAHGKCSDSETISRSQSESSLKVSGNESSLGNSFDKMKLNDQKQERNLTEESLNERDMMFTFSSRPRSAPRSPRNRRKRQYSVTKSPLEENHNLETNDKNILTVPLTRERRESEKSEYDEDFYKNDSESSDDDLLQKLLKSSQASRSSSRGSKHSPRGLLPQEASHTPHVLRTSIKSSLLKEIPSSVIASKSYDSKAYQSRESWRNYQSDAASSWRLDASGSSSSFLDKSLNSSFGDGGPLIQRFPVDNDDICTNDDGDSLTDNDSDETCSTWKAPPPTGHHRYQDEMKHPGPEPDMSATLPIDPRDYADVFSPPIIMPSEKINNESDKIPLQVPVSPPKNMSPSYTSNQITQRSLESESELDLLYDPCLNCYFDPKSNKYYELA